jgi:cytoskeletal protein CcmA (bactofilin family)
MLREVTARAATSGSSQVSNAYPSQTPSIIGGNVLINGNLASAGEIFVEGQVEGNIRGVNVTIGDSAIVKGEIIAERVSVHGQLYGTIRAQHIMLGPKSHVEANMVQETFAIEAGAFFQGNCHHSSNPLADDAAEVPTATIENFADYAGG